MIPKVSVVLSAYNGDPWLDECIKSILGQTFTDFELIITDDGSTDGTWAKINSYKDARIRTLKQENRGIAVTANRGVGLARAAYVARIDQDDVMMPQRLQREFDFLEANPDVALVCTYAQLIYDRKLSSDMFCAPLSSKALHLRLVFECPVVQPSVMFRTRVFHSLGGYNEGKQFFPADDFELWTRMSHEYKLKCLPEALTQYRIRPSSPSHSMQTVDHNILIAANSLHWYLKDAFTYEVCHSLAAIFHRSAKTPSALLLKTALHMFDQVTNIIAGPSQTWDKETSQIYNLQRRMIFFHHLLRRPMFRFFIQRIPALRLR